MQNKKKISQAAIVSYLFVAIAFLLFFLCIILFEDISVYKMRSTRACTTIENYTVEDIQDTSAPAGIQKEYRFTLADLTANEDILGFYLVHSYAEVYIDDELIYEFHPDPDNHFHTAVNSNWVTIPLYPKDTGKEVRVIVTPTYKSVAARKVQFQVGSNLQIFINQLKSDFPQLFLACLCILLGLLIMFVQLDLIFTRKSTVWNLFHLGNFAFLIGLWKISDTRFLPLMFPEHALTFGYIAIGMLFLAPIPLLLFYRDFLQWPWNLPIIIVSIVASCTAFVCLLMQLFNVVDFRESLICSHAIIILTILVTIYFVFSKRKSDKPDRKSNILNTAMIFLLIAGVIADLIKYYISGTSGGAVFTIATFVIFITVFFIMSLLNINKRGYTDAQTGLFNRNRWDYLVKSFNPVPDNVGVMMLDLNGLKKCNDIMGHDAGDRMIFNFSNILRNSISKSNTICRWGGDEFVVLVMDADKEKMEVCEQQILQACTTYNNSTEKPEINFASGYALSSEYPQKNLNELLVIADKQMYNNKRKWYEEHRKQ